MKIFTLLKAFLAIAFWGASFVATKVAVQELTPLTVVVLRFAIGVAGILILLAWRGQAAWVCRSDLGWLALLGLNGVTIHQLLQSTALTTTTASNSGWIVALIPIFTAILAWLVMHESFGPLKILGLGIASAGTILVISHGNLSGGLLQIATIGDFLVLLSAFNWAIFTTLSKKLIGRYPPALMMTYVLAFGWLITLPVFALQGGWQAIPHLSTAGWISVIFLGLACSALAYIFWYDALAEADASQVASLLYLEPIVTVIVAAALIGEQVTWATVAGGATILLGVWLVNNSGSSRVKSLCRQIKTSEVLSKTS